MADEIHALNKNISIHAPTRGATPATRLADMPLSISIHAPTRGATEAHRQQRATELNFNPRSHERSDDKDHGKSCGYGNFNPRSHERSDQTGRQ